MYGYNINEINPYVIYCGHLNETTCPPPGTVYEKRRVKWYEVELILWGEGYIVTEGKKLYARKGDLFFRKPGMVVQGVSPYYCYIIVFDLFYDKENPSYMDENFLDSGGIYGKVCKPEGTWEIPACFDFPHVMNAIHYGELEKFFAGSYNEFIYQREESQLFLKTNLLQILLLMYNEWSSLNYSQHVSRSIRSNYSRVMDVKKYIDSNIESRFKLSELADMAKLSPNFFCRIFRDIVGETLINYINKSKINLAKKMLIESNKGVKEIAYNCGFENDTYFYTLFKRVTGMSPSQYRERQHFIFLRQE